MNKEYTKDPMLEEDLPANGRFIFGSNDLGEHFGGAAKFAHQRLGAEWGVGEGATGRTYAFPTLKWANTRTQQGRVGNPKYTVEEMTETFKRLIAYGKEHPEERLYLTKIGLGIAGYSIDEISKALWDSGAPFELENLVYPIEFELPDDAIKNW